MDRTDLAPLMHSLDWLLAQSRHLPNQYDTVVRVQWIRRAVQDLGKALDATRLLLRIKTDCLASAELECDALRRGAGAGA